MTTRERIGHYCQNCDNTIDTAEMEEKIAHLSAALKVAREAIEGALDRLDVDGDCFDFEGLTNHLREALAAIDGAAFTDSAKPY